MYKLLIKYKELILYLFFGGCTTLINIIVYYLMARMGDISTIPATVAAWVVSVAFAYVTNRIWVFESKNKGIKAILKEFEAFVACRLISGVLDVIIMWLFVDMLAMNDMVIKIISNIIVIIINYIASKCFIFKKREN